MDETLIEQNNRFYKVLNEMCMEPKLIQSKQYTHHGNTSVYDHSVSVAYHSYKLANQLKIQIHERDLIRGAILHDYFLYDWHKRSEAKRWHGFTHPRLALKNAQKDFDLSEIEKDIIKRHMFPLTPIPPKYVEGVIVCLMDKVCSVNETVKYYKRIVAGIFD
ncbi:MAG: HD domain-containing protein [Cellulosilyticaceae bacterium]